MPYLMASMGCSTKVCNMMMHPRNTTQATVQERGQSSVEFALVFAAVLCVIVGLGSLWHLGDNGTIVDHAASAASHHVQGDATSVADVFSY